MARHTEIQIAPRSILDPHPHTLHIPVMGTGFTADTPISVARFGIDSAISLVDDTILEGLRKHHSMLHSFSYTEVKKTDADARYRRIKSYLDVVQKIIDTQMASYPRRSDQNHRDLETYFARLPATMMDQDDLQRADPCGPTKNDACSTCAVPGPIRKIIPGFVDVNIMTKLDRNLDDRGEPRPEGQSDAVAALRGYVDSAARGRIIFSAGMNPRLFAAASRMEPLIAHAKRDLRKGIVLKVSDYRSATIQARYLAQRGLWVDEFRIESSVNCGGHAFVSGGQLLGPVLQEFFQSRHELQAQLHDVLCKALVESGRQAPLRPWPQRVTAQGGIGTYAEAKELMERYAIDGFGVGSPFLLVPEVTLVDPRTRVALANARSQDIRLSDCSPLGVPFWTLVNSESEQIRRHRIQLSRPGSPCPLGHLALQTNSDGIPVCPASRAYQRENLERVQHEPKSLHEQTQRQLQIVSKACLCHDLSAAAWRRIGVPKQIDHPAVCPGPNLAWFTAEMSLDQVLNHYYGRSEIEFSAERPHMFEAEWRLQHQLLEAHPGSPQHAKATDKDRSNYKKQSQALNMAVDSYSKQGIIIANAYHSRAPGIGPTTTAP